MCAMVGGATVLKATLPRQRTVSGVIRDRLCEDGLVRGRASLIYLASVLPRVDHELRLLLERFNITLADTQRDVGLGVGEMDVGA